MYKIGIFLILFLLLCILSCNKEKPEELNLDPEIEALVNILQDEWMSIYNQGKAVEDKVHYMIYFDKSTASDLLK
jgi:hypothetical protein